MEPAQRGLAPAPRRDDGRPLSLELKLNRFGVPAHFNKFGKPYDKNATPGY